MAPQVIDFLPCQMKHEIGWESILVSAYRSFQLLCLNAIKSRQIPIKHDPFIANHNNLTLDHLGWNESFAASHGHLLSEVFFKPEPTWPLPLCPPLFLSHQFTVSLQNRNVLAPLRLDLQRLPLAWRFAFKAVGVILPGHVFILDGLSMRAIHQTVLTGPVTFSGFSPLQSAVNARQASLIAVRCP